MPQQSARLEKSGRLCLAETKRHYEMVSELYDQAVAQSGAAQLKVERRRNAAQKSRLYPALAAAETWLHAHKDPVPIKQHLEIPVLSLRWTHSCMSQKLRRGMLNHAMLCVDEFVWSSCSPDGHGAVGGECYGCGGSVRVLAEVLRKWWRCDGVVCG